MKVQFARRTAITWCALLVALSAGSIVRAQEPQAPQTPPTIEVDEPKPVPTGVVRGRVTSFPDGTPFAGAIVSALRAVFIGDRREMVTVAEIITDDKGAYRLFGLPAGQYFISAVDPAFLSTRDHLGPLVYAATFYPGVATPEGATRLAIRGAMVGSHYLRVENLPEPWSLDTVYFQGQDITDIPMSFQFGEEVRSLRLVLTDLSIRIDGTLVSTPRDDLESLSDPRVLDTLTAGALVIRLAEGQQLTQTLRVPTAPDGTAAAAARTGPSTFPR